MGIYLPYHCFSRLCRKLAKPRVVNRVEPFSWDCVIDGWCFASTRNKKDTPRGCLFYFSSQLVNQPLETAKPFLRFCASTAYDKHKLGAKPGFIACFLADVLRATPHSRSAGCRQLRQATANGGLRFRRIGQGQGHRLHRAKAIPRPIADGGDRRVAGSGDAVGSE